MPSVGWQIDPPDARILHARDDLFGVVGAPVANDEQLEISHGLIKDARDRIAEDGAAVVGRNDYRDARRCHGDRCSTEAQDRAILRTDPKPLTSWSMMHFF